MQLTHIRKSATKKNTVLYFHVTLKGDIYRLHTSSDRTELSNKNEDISNLSLAKSKDFLEFKEARAKGISTLMTLSGYDTSSVGTRLQLERGQNPNLLTLDESPLLTHVKVGDKSSPFKINTDGYISGIDLDINHLQPGITADYFNISTPSAKLDSQLKNDFKWLYSVVGKELEKVLQKHPDATFTGVSINYEVKKEDVINIEL